MDLKEVSNFQDLHAYRHRMLASWLQITFNVRPRTIIKKKKEIVIIIFATFVWNEEVYSQKYNKSEF